MAYILEADNILALLTIKLGMKKVSFSDMLKLRDLFSENSELLVNISDDSVDNALFHYAGLFKKEGENIIKIDNPDYKFLETDENSFNSEFMDGFGPVGIGIVKAVLKEFSRN